MSPQPKPIANYLADLDAPAVPSRPAMPQARPAPQRVAHPAPPTRVPEPANAADELRARAFEEGKREGLKLAEAKHALDRRRRENEDERRAGERIAEAEARLGAQLAERLEGELAALAARVEGEIVECLAPVLGGLAERRAVERVAADAAGFSECARFDVSGPDGLVRAFLARLPEALRSRANVKPGDGVDLVVEADAARLTTRLARVQAALAAL